MLRDFGGLFRDFGGLVPHKFKPRTVLSFGMRSIPCTRLAGDMTGHGDV